MEILERYGAQMQQDLHEWAKEHAESFGSPLVVLDNDSVRYPHQKMFIHTIDDKQPLDPALIDGVASDIDPRYTAISAAVEDDKNKNAVDLMYEVLDSRQNVILGTDHQELIDIALILAKVTNYLKSNYGNGDGDIRFASSILVNKMVAWLGVELGGRVVPATEVLQWAFDATYMSIPNTASSRERLKTPRKAIVEYNSRMVEHGIERRLAATHSRKVGRAMLLGVALSGTVNKKLDRAKAESAIEPPPGGDIYVMGQASRGMLRFMKHALTFAACANLGDGEIDVDISDRPLSISSPQKLEEAMARLCAMKNTDDPNNYFVYDQFGNLPVIRN